MKKLVSFAIILSSTLSFSAFATLYEFGCPDANTIQLYHLGDDSGANPVVKAMFKAPRTEGMPNDLIGWGTGAAFSIDPSKSKIQTSYTFVDVNVIPPEKVICLYKVQVLDIHDNTVTEETIRMSPTGPANDFIFKQGTGYQKISAIKYDSSP